MNKKRYVVFAASLLSILILLFILVWYKNQEFTKIDFKVRIGYQQTILYLPVFVAQERGYFKKHGVEAELVNFASAPDMMQALLAGQIDATGISALDVIGNVEQERPGQLKFYLIGAFGLDENNSPDYLIARQGSGISTIKDLKSKKLGVRPGVTVETYAKVILKKNGIDPEKQVQVIKLAENLQAQALQSGQIDALFTFAPLANIILEQKVGILVDRALVAKYLLEKPSDIYTAAGIFLADYVSQNPETVQKIQDAIYEAIDYITLHSQEAKQLLPKYTPITIDVANKVSLIKWIKVNDADKEKVQEMILFYYRNGILKQKIDLRQNFLTDSELK